METQRFDALARLLGRATARRRLLAGLTLNSFVGLITARQAVDVAARKKRRKGKKNKKPQPNAYGCLNVGAACKSEEQCCSGICEGKKGKRKCAAHDVAICQMDSDICSGQAVLCGDPNPNCACVQTTGNAPFCGDYTGSPGEMLCRDCSQDTDCEAEFGPGAACVVYSGLCADMCLDTGTACVPACADADM